MAVVSVMDLNKIYHRKDLVKLPFSSGWLITKNELYTSEIEEIDILFSATNLQEGKAISVEYDEESKLFSLILIEQLRKNGSWDLVDFSNGRLISESTLIEDIFVGLKKILLGRAPQQLIHIKIPVWWYIRRNLLTKNVERVNNKEFDMELLFAAYTTTNKKPYYIEVSRLKKEPAPYIIFVGQSEQRIPKSKIRFFQPFPFEKSKEIRMSSLSEIIDFLNDYFFAPERFIR